jgi:hypothetical protein
MKTHSLYILHPGGRSEGMVERREWKAERAEGCEWCGGRSLAGSRI